MKLEVETKVVDRSNVQSEDDFRIRGNAQAFRILSDSLYSDKPLAILRELGCNAYDAHVDADNLDTPFDIHFPNEMDSRFRIRDYGTGMAQDDMETVYRTYFHSTKTNSNDQIGCLGLGSKTPFAYADSFNATSYYNGKFFSYKAHINEEGTPALALIETGDTDEHNGLEVSFDVKRSDWSSFTHKINKAFRYFKVLPHITGTDVSITPISYVLKNEDWGVREASYGDTMAVMGNVAYSIDNLDVEDMTDEESSLLRNKGLDLFFKIGEVDVQPSREGLQFNARTIKAIRARLAKVISDIRKDARQQIAECSNLWDARIMATEVSEGVLSSFSFLFEGHDIFKWGGESLSTKGVVQLDYKELLGIKKSNDFESESDVAEFISDKISILRFREESSRRSMSGFTLKKESTSKIVASEDTRLYHNDIPRGQHIRCKQQATESDTDRVYLVSCSEKVKKKIEAKLGVSIPSVGEIEVVKEKIVREGVASVYNPKNAKKILVFDVEQIDSYNKSTCWKSEKVDLSDGGIYVQIDRYKVKAGVSKRIWGDERNGQAVYKRYKNLLATMDLEMPVLHGIKPSLMDKVHEVNADKEGTWITLQEYFEAKLEEYLSDINNRKVIVNSQAWKDFKNSSDVRYGKVLNSINHINNYEIKTTGKLEQFVKTYLNMEEGMNSYYDLEQLIHWGDIVIDDEFKKDIEVASFLDQHNEVKDMYFMLDHVNAYSLGKEELEKYIAMTEMYISMTEMCEMKNGSNGKEG
jgi:hypothetical protein